MRYESGEIEPGLGNLMKIASILKIQPDKLFDDYYHFLSYPYSQKIKELRKQMKLTQREFAVLLSVDRKTVARWENGKIIITRLSYDKVKDYIGKM